MKARLTLLVAALAVAAPLRAQFHAPDTEYHDISQRTFPVEAARVLAWLRNGGGEKTAEVAYQVETTPERETVWTIEWRNTDGKPLRERTVRYGEGKLLEGPSWFREVFAQLCGEDWKLRPASAEDPLPAFWKGAELAGVSRMEGVSAATKLLTDAPKMETAAEASRLAGLLAHAALPIFGTQLTLDSVLLARAAAWLCIAEARLGDAIPAAWPPIQFLAGREQLAGREWKKLGVRPAEKLESAARFWDFALRTPSVKESFLFAARPENRQFALPAMAYHAQCDAEWARMIVEVGEELLGAPLTQRHYEYAPMIAERGGIAGGHTTGDGTTRAIGAWLGVLASLPPGDLERTDFRAPLSAIQSSLGDEDDWARLVQAVAPLFNHALQQSSGPLVPVAHVTTRDLLAYGWEQSALQIGARHNFLKNGLGDPQGAQAMSAAALSQLHGIDVFLVKAEGTPAFPLGDTARLQFMAGLQPAAILLQRPPAHWQPAADGYLRRTWLWKTGGNTQSEALARSGAPDETMRTALHRLLAEGGPLAGSRLFFFEPSWKLPEKLRALGLRPVIAAAQPSSLFARAETDRDQARQNPGPLS